MHGAAEGALVLDGGAEPVEVGAGALLDPGPPQVDDLLRRRGRRLAGQPLAHDQRHRVLDRGVGPVGDVGVIAAVVAVLQHGREIAGDAVHAPGADRLDAHLLDRVEHRARALRLGQQPAVGRRIVAGEPQRHRIGVAAHDGGIARRELARRLRQPRLGALAVADDARLVGRVGHLEVRRARQRAHAGRDRPLEGLLRRLGGGGGLAVGRGCGHVSLPAT